MLRVDIPGFGPLRIESVVLDFNGTLAIDGRLIPGVRDRLSRLARSVTVGVLTADTFGKARSALRGLPCEVTILGRGAHDRAKAAHVRRLGAARCACIGNGRNDRLMLRAAALAIVVLQAEGAASETLREADIVIPDVRDALDLLLEPRRMVATLRS